jgi:hypothetical protein
LNPARREAALVELSKKREMYEDLALVLWGGFGMSEGRQAGSGALANDIRHHAIAAPRNRQCLYRTLAAIPHGPCL